jgi:4-methylaminobutanoate oxidase (formaldehyde-forming)
MVDSAEIVIIGGGILGCSIAYHLTKMGKTDVVLLEKNGLTHGATWHAAGLVGQLRNSRNTTRMLQHSVALYDELEAESELGISWKKVGSLRVASSKDRMKEILQLATTAKSFGLEMHILNALQAKELFPLMSTDGVEGAAYIPSDGYIDPSSLTQALAKGARSRGAKIIEGICVEDVKTDGKRRVTEVVTDQGVIKAGIVVNACGMWAQGLAQKSGVRIPACALEHQYIVTDPIPDMPDNMPTMRDPDNLVYYKPEVRGMVVGGYEPNTVPFGDKGIPKAFGQELLNDNFDRFEQLAILAAKRTPVINEVGVRTMVNGAIPYSADGDFVMGKAPEMDNYYVASGFLYGIAAGGGAGKMMAEWILDGEPSLNLWPLDIRRFGPHHNSKKAMYERAVELYGKHYTMHWPFEEHESARGIRRSPLYELLKERGAVFGSKSGWERPNWFAPEGVEAKDQCAFENPNWFKHAANEHRLVREGVALIDQSSFSKFEVRGNGALNCMERLAVANIDRPVGSVIYTQFCNERGGIESDITITRMGDQHFYVVTGSSFGVHDCNWINTHLPEDGSVILSEVTSSRAVINLCGPLARKVLEKVAEEDVSNSAFPFGQSRQLTLGAAPVLALRITYVGELGWELHVPTEYAAHVYEELERAGEEFGIGNVGYRAIDSLRMEKGYLYWSTDLSPDYTPYEAGLGFCVDLNKPDFIGKQALAEVKREGVKQKLCTFVLERAAPVFGGEAVICDGEVLGVTCSGNFAHTLGKPVVFAYVPIAYAEKTDFVIEVMGEAIPAIRSNRVLYDPSNEKIKA